MLMASYKPACSYPARRAFLRFEYRLKLLRQADALPEAHPLIPGVWVAALRDKPS
jgi:hypothetical protein